MNQILPVYALRAVIIRYNFAAREPCRDKLWNYRVQYRQKLIILSGDY